MGIALRITDQPDADIIALGQALCDDNAQAVGPSNKQDLAVLANDENGKLLAGLFGYTAWGWLYIRWLWVDTASRGCGIAGTLLEHAEAEARKRGCIGAHIDTFNPQAQLIYERHGYSVFGELPDFVAGRSRSFLHKRWTSSSDSEAPS